MRNILVTYVLRLNMTFRPSIALYDELLKCPSKKLFVIQIAGLIWIHKDENTRTYLKIKSYRRKPVSSDSSIFKWQFVILCFI